MKKSDKTKAYPYTPIDYPNYQVTSRSLAQALTPGLYVYPDGEGIEEPKRIAEVSPYQGEDYPLLVDGAYKDITPPPMVEITFDDGQRVQWLERRGCSVLELAE